MSAQNTHHIPVFDHVFSSFHLVISVFYRRISDTQLFLLFQVKKVTFGSCVEIGRELSLNVSTLRSYDVLPISTNVATSPRLIQREFFRYKK